MATAWHKTDFKGVRYRKHPKRKHGIKFDQYFVITYKLDGVTKSEAIGWASEGHSASESFEKLCELKRNQKSGQGPRTIAEAKQEAELKREQIKRERTAAEQKNKTLNQYWPEYYKTAKKSKKKVSYEKEESHYRLWLSPLLGHISLNDIKLEQWDLLTEALSKDGKSKRTQEYVTGTLRRILKHAYHRRLIDEAPPSGKRIGVTGPGNSNRRRRIIRPDEAEAILSKLEETDRSAWRITRFAFLTGCRASEAFNLCYRDIDLISQIITFPETKNKDPRSLPISESLKQIFDEIPEGKPQDRVFLSLKEIPYKEAPSAFRTVVDALKLNEGRAPLDKISFHSIRHSVATELAKRLNIRELMDVMGWRTVLMATRYIKGDEDTKRNALAGLEQALKPQEGKILPFNKKTGST
ncbi:MAG: site-specific integrase [Desulfobacter sp.]|nr:MAG: site-specific integrase [Desulfobacter sp.]